MRKFLYNTFFALSLLICVIGCKNSKESSPEDKAKITVEKFINYLKLNEADSAQSIYPECNFFNNIHVGQFSILSVKPFGDNSFSVICNNSHYNDNGELVNSSVQFLIDTDMFDGEEIQRIQNSKGLLQLPSPLMTFLTKTGAIGDNNDVEIANEFSAYRDFVYYAIEKYQMDLDRLAEQEYTGDEYFLYLSQYPHINGVRKLSPIKSY